MPPRPLFRLATLSSHVRPHIVALAANAAVPVAPTIVDATPEFVTDPIAFLAAQSLLHKDAFTLRRGSSQNARLSHGAQQQYVVLCDPQLIESALSDEQNFFAPTVTNLFGISQDLLGDPEARIIQRLRGFLIKNSRELAGNIADEMQAHLDRTLGDEGVLDLRELGEALFWPMTTALFGGHSSQSAAPELYDTWRTIDSLFGKALRGPVPEVQAAVDGAAQHFRHSLAGASACPVGPVLDFYKREVSGAGGDDEATARFAVAAWWGGLGNTWPSIVWAFGMILADARYRRMAYEEVDQYFHSHQNEKLRSDFEQLPFLTAAFKEVLRLKTYSVAWRVTTSDVELQSESGKRFLLAKKTVVAVPWCIQHYNERLWSEPWAFRPERHLPGSEELKSKGLSAVRERLALSPFSWGPHKCSGASLATLEIPAALAVVFRAFDMELIDDLPGQDWRSAFGVVGPDDRPARVRFRRRARGGSP